MSRIDEIFAALRAENRKGLMPFVCAGRPGLDRLPDTLAAIEEAGASIVEIGFPFSDPIADGPVIAAAMHRALLDGVTPRGVFEAVARARESVKLGLVAMVSVSIVRRLGEEAFIGEAKAAGFDGFIFPDLPVEEAGETLGAVKDAGLTASLLVAPTTDDERAARICGASTGFVYLLARVGITGERADAPQVAAGVARLRARTDLPVACGFGVSTPEHVAAVTAHADAAIVGSALVRRVETAIDSGADAVAEAASFVRGLAGGLPAV